MTDDQNHDIFKDTHTSNESQNSSHLQQDANSLKDNIIQNKVIDVSNEHEDIQTINAVIHNETSIGLGNKNKPGDLQSNISIISSSNGIKSLNNPNQSSKIERKRLIAKYTFSQINNNNYTRGCLFSPDGLCILTYNEDNTIRLFDPPQETRTVTNETNQVESHQWQPALSVSIAGPIYDVEWYPLMNSADPGTCCLAVTSQYQPVHLYDAYDGHLRATYR